MPDSRQVEKSLVDAAKSALLEVQAKLPPKPNGEPAGWPSVAAEINTAIEDHRDRVTRETVRNLALYGEGGRKAVDAVAAYMRAHGKPLPVGETAKRYVQRPERYHVVEEAFTNARRAGVSEQALDLAREYIGELKSETGPTREECESTIVKAVRELRRLASLYLVSSAAPANEATDLDDLEPAPRKESGTVPRQRTVDASAKRASIKR